MESEAMTDVGPLSDFPEGRGRAVPFAGRKVAIFRIEGKLYAIQDKCPHMAASLADGPVEDGRFVVCHMHGWKFDIRTGAGAPPSKSWACAQVYEVEVVNGRVRLGPAERTGEKRPPEEDWPVWDDAKHLRPKDEDS